MENTINQLKSIRVNLIYEKKKHFNAAERKRNYHKWISILNIVLNAFSSSSLLFYLCNSGQKGYIIFSLIVALLTFVMSSIQEFYKFNVQSEANNRAGNMYLGIIKNINMTLALVKDNKISDDNFIMRCDKIMEDISEISSFASNFSTNKRDYEKARKGIKSGEEKYTDLEMELFY